MKKATRPGSGRHRHRDRLSPSLAAMPWVFLRLLLGGGLAALAIGAAVAVYVVGAIATTGCFIECQEPNLVVGVPSLVIAAALLAVGLGALWWGLVDRYWRTATQVLAAAGFVAVFVMMALVTSG